MKVKTKDKPSSRSTSTKKATGSKKQTGTAQTASSKGDKSAGGTKATKASESSKGAESKQVNQGKQGNQGKITKIQTELNTDSFQDSSSEAGKQQIRAQGTQRPPADPPDSSGPVALKKKSTEDQPKTGFWTSVKDAVSDTVSNFGKEQPAHAQLTTTTGAGFTGVFPSVFDFNKPPENGGVESRAGEDRQPQEPKSANPQYQKLESFQYAPNPMPVLSAYSDTGEGAEAEPGTSSEVNGPDKNPEYAIDSDGNPVLVESSNMVNGPPPDVSKYKFEFDEKGEALVYPKLKQYPNLLEKIQNKDPSADQEFNQYWNDFKTAAKTFDDLYPNFEKKMNDLKAKFDAQGGKLLPEDKGTYEELKAWKEATETVNAYLNTAWGTANPMRVAWLKSKLEKEPVDDSYLDPEYLKAYNGHEARQEVWFAEQFQYWKLEEDLGLSAPKPAIRHQTYDYLTSQYNEALKQFEIYRNEGTRKLPPFFMT